MLLATTTAAAALVLQLPHLSVLLNLKDKWQLDLDIAVKVEPFYYLTWGFSYVG
jgi:hypothetical protein